MLRAWYRFYSRVFNTISRTSEFTCIREFNSIKLICRKLYALFHMRKKAYTANQHGVQLFSHVDV